ncbi:MAG: hypothetical protein ABJA78_00125 [Ferruginibacter sp.]
MSTSSKSKILLIAVIVLLLTNIGMLFFFLRDGDNNDPGKRPPRGREVMMKEFLQKEIGFNEKQMQQYDTLSKQHRDNVKASFDEVRASKQEWYRQLGAGGFTDSAINGVASRTAEVQQQMEYKMLLHFKEIRKLCSPDQQPKFDSLFYKVWDKKAGDKKKDPNK